ncbi:MAG: hypothetical protein V8S34_08070 [Lawsonibacter sp.]
MFQKAVDDEDCTGMGTTLVAALAGSGRPFSSTRGTAGPITSMGGITRITRDHSLVEDWSSGGS